MRFCAHLVNAMLSRSSAVTLPTCVMSGSRAASYNHRVVASFSLFVRVPMSRDANGNLVGFPYPAMEKLNGKLAMEGNEKRDKERKVSIL